MPKALAKGFPMSGAPLQRRSRRLRRPTTTSLQPSAVRFSRLLAVPPHLQYSRIHMSHLRIWRSPHPHLKLPFPQTPGTDDIATVCFGTKSRGELFAVVLVKDFGYVVWCLQHPKTSGASEPGYHQWLQYLCRRARYRYHAPGDGQVVAASSVGQAREEQCRIQ